MFFPFLAERFSSPLVQILHPFAGSLQQYAEEVTDPDRYRPDHCPQCQTPHSLIAHGFYSRTLVDAGFDDSIRVRRYLCRSCKRTVSLLPEFALPYLRFSIPVMALFLVVRLLQGATLPAAAGAAAQSAMPYERGHFWIRRLCQQAATLCAARAALAAAPPANLVRRALEMLQSIGWIRAHRFLFADQRCHLLGWPAFLSASGRRRPRPAGCGQQLARIAASIGILVVLTPPHQPEGRRKIEPLSAPSASSSWPTWIAMEDALRTPEKSAPTLP